MSLIVLVKNRSVEREAGVEVRAIVRMNALREVAEMLAMVYGVSLDVGRAGGSLV